MPVYFLPYIVNTVAISVHTREEEEEVKEGTLAKKAPAWRLHTYVVLL